MIDLDELERRVTERPLTFSPPTSEDMLKLLALARAGRRLAEAVEAGMGSAQSLAVDWDASAKGPYFTVKAVDKTDAIDDALAAWREADGG